jgi:tRNA threonylcarbamoyladenosine biosynthesis protein TsaB
MSELSLLAIETSSATGTVALSVDGEVCERTIPTAREQTGLVLAFVDELLDEAGIGLGDLDALVFGRGPGSFTGLRVAAAVAQGLSLASGVPIVSVSSLAALAQAGFERSPSAGIALCCVDARMGEVYSASFERVDGLAALVTEERIGRPEAIEAPSSAFLALGDAFAVYAPVLEGTIGTAAAIDAAVVPAARQLVVLAEAEVAAGRFLPLEAALPVYLRGSDAWRKPAT